MCVGAIIKQRSECERKRGKDRLRAALNCKSVMMANEK